MDSTTRQRYISTSIWSDEWFDSLSTLEKLIYFHLLTNEFTNAAGVYHFSLKQIRTDLDISRDEVNAAMEKFEAAGKAYFFEEYIVIPKWLKHQKISERNKIFLGVLAILRGLPDEIKRFIADRRHYDFPVEKYMQIPSIIHGPCPVKDGPPPKKVWPIPKKGVGHTKNTGNSAHDSDSDSDSDLDSDSDIGGGGSSDHSDPPKSENPVREEPPPQFLNGIKKISAAAGFVIGNPIARRFARSGLSAAWFLGKHNFLEFMAHNVRAKYPQEPPERQRDIFISAITWENLRDAYPAWRDQREAGDREKIAAHARDHPPEVCPGCGGALYGHQCAACGGFVEFRPEKLVWDFIPPGGFDLAGDFRDKIRGKGALDKLTEGLDF